MEKFCQLSRSLLPVCKNMVPSTCVKSFSTSTCTHNIRTMTRVNICDNSKIGHDARQMGKPAKVIGVYNKSRVGHIGNKVTVAVAGKVKRGYIVGCRQKQRTFIPRFDANNVVLVEDNGTPTGTRIKVPIPSTLRGMEGDFTKILSIATRFL